MCTMALELASSSSIVSRTRLSVRYLRAFANAVEPQGRLSASPISTGWQIIGGPATAMVGPSSTAAVSHSVVLIVFDLPRSSGSGKSDAVGGPSVNADSPERVCPCPAGQPPRMNPRRRTKASVGPEGRTEH